MTQKSISNISTGPTLEGFNVEICEEHLEESSFLYEQRLGLFNDFELSWKDLDAFIEQRFESHISALELSDRVGIEICKQQSIEGDFGELHAAIRVFCRQDRQDLIEEVLDELDFDDEERVKAVSDALCYELPEPWQDEFLNSLFEKGPDCSILATQIIAYKRLDYSNKLYDIFFDENTPKELIISVFYALGRIRPKLSKNYFHRFLNHEDIEIVDAAVNALIRVGDQNSLSELMTQIKPENLPKLSIGLFGNKDSVNEIIKKTNSEEEKQIHKDDILAIGLLGNISIIPNLIKYLSIEEISENAALALNLISGAELYEEHFIPEEIDEDMLFEDELEKHLKGELYAPGEEPGETITRLSQNPETWQLWWEENQKNFNPELRYRNGELYSPECLIENLKSEKSPNIIRKLAYEELVIRYEIDVPFETDMLVQDQIKAIASYENWIKTNPNTFKKGIWYYNGQPI